MSACDGCCHADGDSLVSEMPPGFRALLHKMNTRAGWSGGPIVDDIAACRAELLENPPTDQQITELDGPWLCALREIVNDREMDQKLNNAMKAVEAFGW